MYHRDITLLDATAVLNEVSSWVLMTDFTQAGVVLSGLGVGDEVTPQYSNDEGITSSISNIENGTVITADGFNAITLGMKWFRVKRTSIGGGGSVTAKLTGSEY